MKKRRTHQELEKELKTLRARVAELERFETDGRQTEEEIQGLARFPSENPFPVLRVDREGVVLYANNASKILLRDWGCAVGGLASAYWRDVVTDALTSQSKKTLEVSVGEQTFACVVAPIADASYANLYVSDVTERTRAEQALQLVAHTLAGNVRAIDVVARYGGDEFVIIMPDCRGQEAQQVADRLKAQIKARHLPVENESIALDFSVGIAISNLTDGETLDSLLIRADAEMYRQKQCRRAQASSNA